MLPDFPAISALRPFVLDRYNNFPTGHYISVVTIRKTETEAIFRTEGSGEGLVKETVVAGLRTQRRIRRVVISKRKQVAVERRTGRELLRDYAKLYPDENSKQKQICALNTNSPCGRCVDCMLYGYAVGNGGAQKSRVMTDDAYSIAPVAQVTGKRTFNAPYDNGTMRHPITGVSSNAINEDEFVVPETHFLDIETLKDVTAGELVYVLGNILRSARYGAISSRIGKIRNTIAAVICGDAEIFSNLELTQAAYDELMGGGDELETPLFDDAVAQATRAGIATLLPRVLTREPRVIQDAALAEMLGEVAAAFRDEGRTRALLDAIERGYAR